MWKCLNCGAEFEEPEIETTDIPGVWFDRAELCPECKIDDIEKLHLCRCGREYITDEQDRCPQCEKEIIEAIKEAKQRIMNGCNVDYQQATEDIVSWIEKEA